MAHKLLVQCDRQENDPVRTCVRQIFFTCVAILGSLYLID